MLRRHSWLAGLLGLAGLLQPRAGAADYTLDPSRTPVTFEMRRLGTPQRGELDIVIDARSLRASNAATAKFVRGPSMLNTEGISR